MRTALTVFICIWFMRAGPGACAEPDPAFARELYAKGYPSLAALEWARIAATDTPAAPAAQLEMAYSLWRAGDSDSARRLLAVLAADDHYPPPLRLHARCLAVMIDLAEARFPNAGSGAEAILRDSENLPAALRDDLRKTVAAAHLVSGDRAAALERLDLTRPNEAAIAAEVAEPLSNRKSPLLAGTLSAIVPGAGQVYCGRTSDGAIAFLVNALLIGTTVESFADDRPWLGTTTAVFSAGWYLGNIYSAVNSAHKHNETRRANRTLDWLKRLDLGLSEESLRLALRVDF